MEGGTVAAPMKAIETQYNGYRFRSRTEARWAVFLDALNIPYQYEPEGFDLDGVKYLPDFYLPTLDCWLEIKPDGELSAYDEQKTQAFADALVEADEGTQFVVLHGMPGLAHYHGGTERSDHVQMAPYWDKPFHWSMCPACERVGIVFSGWAHYLPCECSERYGTSQAVSNVSTGETRYVLMPAFKKMGGDSEPLIKAYEKARSARFEFGQSG